MGAYTALYIRCTHSYEAPVKHGLENLFSKQENLQRGFQEIWMEISLLLLKPNNNFFKNHFKK